MHFTSTPRPSGPLRFNLCPRPPSPENPCPCSPLPRPHHCPQSLHPLPRSNHWRLHPLCRTQTMSLFSSSSSSNSSSSSSSPAPQPCLAQPLHGNQASTEALPAHPTARARKCHHHQLPLLQQPPPRTRPRLPCLWATCLLLSPKLTSCKCSVRTGKSSSPAFSAAPSKRVSRCAFTAAPQLTHRPFPRTLTTTPGSSASSTSTRWTLPSLLSARCRARLSAADPCALSFLRCSPSPLAITSAQPLFVRRL